MDGYIYIYILILLLFAQRLTVFVMLNSFFLRNPLLVILKELIILYLNGVLLLGKRGLIEVIYLNWIALDKF